VRLLAAATAANDAGQLDQACLLAEQAAELPGDEVLRAKLALLRATMSTPDRPAHIAALPAAAARITKRDPELAMALLTQASHSAWSNHYHELAVQAAAQLRELLTDSGVGTNSFAEAVAQQALVFVGHPGADVQVVHSYIARICRSPADIGPGERLIASVMAFWAGDHDATWTISAALVADCRTRGLVGWLAGALQGLAMAQILRGEWDSAKASALEGLRLATDTGQEPRATFFTCVLSGVAAHIGDHDGFTSWLARAAQNPGTSATDPAPWYHGGRALLDLADGRFSSAREHLDELPQWWERGTAFYYQPDLIEAAVRSGKIGQARQQAAKFEAWAAQAGHQWANAVAQRCRGLVTDGDTADEHYREAVRLHDGAGRPFEQARTHLLCGEWLRRNRRRADARVQLTAAFGLFTELGAAAWAGRASRELAATGARPAERRARPMGALTLLTAQELLVVQLAAQGLSNRDIAAQLFLSPRTVGHHLYKAYPKLGVTTRGELARILDGRTPVAITDSGGPQAHLAFGS
jgi:DNA-binding CsgD family transcriptional regulator